METAANTRAVRRPIEPGTRIICPQCTKPVMFKAREKKQQVICNVYVDDRWDRVEHFHETCYLIAEEPHGPVIQ